MRLTTTTADMTNPAYRVGRPEVPELLTGLPVHRDLSEAPRPQREQEQRDRAHRFLDELRRFQQSGVNERGQERSSAASTSNHSYQSVYPQQQRTSIQGTPSRSESGYEIPSRSRNQPGWFW